jgi:hypothetical protein
MRLLCRITGAGHPNDAGYDDRVERSRVLFLELLEERLFGKISRFSLQVVPPGRDEVILEGRSMFEALLCN